MYVAETCYGVGVRCECCLGEFVQLNLVRDMSTVEGIYSRIARAGGVHARVFAPVYARYLSCAYVCAWGSLSRMRGCIC